MYNYQAVSYTHLSKVIVELNLNHKNYTGLEKEEWKQSRCVWLFLGLIIPNLLPLFFVSSVVECVILIISVIWFLSVSCPFTPVPTGSLSQKINFSHLMSFVSFLSQWFHTLRVVYYILYYHILSLLLFFSWQFHTIEYYSIIIFLSRLYLFDWSIQCVRPSEVFTPNLLA